MANSNSPASSQVPEGVTLTADERVVAGGAFAFSNVLFFLHWKMAVTSKRLVGHTPNTVLGVIPLGSNDVSYPLAAIAGVSVRTAYSILWIVIGALLLLVGIAAVNVIVILLGIVALAAGFAAEISVTNSGGGRIGHRVAIFNRGAARVFVDQVNQAIATYAHQTQVVVAAAPAPAQPTSSASDALAQLSSLRDSGHLTADEYDAKRREIINRI